MYEDEDDVPTGEFELPDLEFDQDGNPVIPRVTDEWLWTMQAAVRRMQQSTRFEVTREDTFRPVPEIVRETVQSAAGVVAAPTISSLYDVTDGYELEWNYQYGEESAEGRIHLYGFAEVFGTWLHQLWGEHAEDAPQREQDFSWEIRGFDAAEGNGRQVVMHTPEHLPSYDLYWYAPNERAYPLRIDFLQYLECLTHTCGLSNWQLLVADFDPEGDPEAAEKAALCAAQLERLFPDADLSAFGRAPSATPTDSGADEEE
jgi:hypothetical protein